MPLAVPPAVPEIWHEQLRWRQDGIEIQLEGARVELARQLAADLTIPM